MPNDDDTTEIRGHAVASDDDAAAARARRLYDRLLRLTAEFDNYRKRTERERRELSEAAGADVIRDLLPVARRPRARAGARRPTRRRTRAFASGVELIHRQLLDVAAPPRRRAARRRRPGLRSRVARGRRRRAGRRPARRRDHRRSPARLPDRSAAAAPGHGQGGEGVSRRDYYEVLGVDRSAERAGNQERLSQAGAEVPPRSQPRRHGRPRNASRKRPRPTPCSATPEKRARYDRFGHAGVAGAGGAGPGLQPRHLRGLLRHPRRLLRLRRRPARGPGARRRPALRPRDLVRRVVRGHRDHDPDSARGTCETCKGTRRAPKAPRRRPARSAAAPASCASSRASSSSRGRAASAAAPARSSATLPRLPRHRPHHDATGASPSGFPPGIADGQRLRLHGEGEHGALGGPTGDLYVVIHVRPHPVFRREDDDLFVEVPVPYPTMAMGGSFKVDGPAGPLDGGRARPARRAARSSPSAARACRA